MASRTIGIDLGKSVGAVALMGRRGKVVARKKLSQGALGRWLATVPRCRVGIEAGSGAHHLGRRLRALGHEVPLMPPHDVRPFRKPMTNDMTDAEACAEAVQRPAMRFVPLRSPEQLDAQARHRVRARLVAERTRLINRLRGLVRARHHRRAGAGAAAEGAGARARGRGGARAGDGGAGARAAGRPVAAGRADRGPGCGDPRPSAP